MCNAWVHVIRMYNCDMTMIQIRNVPEDVHRRLKIRAAQLGVSLSDLALAELNRSLERPTRAELLERVAARSVVLDGPSSADLVAKGREGR